jgi:hypothetical protein
MLKPIKAEILKQNNLKDLDYKTVLAIQREIEDYVDYLSKSNEMWRKSQEDIAYLILDKIQNLKKISEVKPNSSHD